MSQKMKKAENNDLIDEKKEVKNKEEVKKKVESEAKIEKAEKDKKGTIKEEKASKEEEIKPEEKQLEDISKQKVENILRKANSSQTATMNL